MKYTVKEVTDVNQWEQLPIECWQHTWEYGNVQKISNRQVSRYVIEENTKRKNIGYFQMITYPLFGNKTISYIPYGPVLNDSFTKENYNELQKTLHTIGQKNNSIAVRTELPEKFFGKKLPLFAYKTSFHQARGEVIMNIDEPNVMSNGYSKSTRRNINKAIKNNLVTEFYFGKDIINYVGDFIAINTENTKSHNTTTHSDLYFENLFSVLSKNKNNFLALVKSHDNTLLAINIFVVFNNNAYCPFGASTTDGKKMGAYYLIKDQSIQKMHELGIQSFNWGGISIGKNDSNLSGLNAFKLGFGGKEKHHNNFYDVVISPLYYLYLLRTWFRK